MSYSEMIANSESCPYDGTSQLVICNMLVSIFNLVLSPANSIIISKRCQWERMSWPMGDQQTESTSSPQTGRNQGLTTPMSSGSRTEKCCWRKRNKHCLSLERVPPKIPTAIVFPLATHGSYDKDNPQGQTGLKEEIINLPFLSEWCPRGIST